MSYPDYIDCDGDLWTYGPDINGDIGYHVDGGAYFPFEADVNPDDEVVAFEYIKKEFDLQPVGTRYCLVITERDEDTAPWIEGPYVEADAYERRSQLWDSGSYSIEMYEFRGGALRRGMARAFLINHD